jgi:predicted DNA-binding protein (MmcQ/YjbR family)
MTVEEIRKFCLSLPSVTEDVKWEDHLCFNIGGKMFCITVFENPITASIKVSDEDFKALTVRPGIIPAPYLARNMWVKIEKPGALKLQEWQHYLRESYRLVLEKLPVKLQQALTGGTSKSAQKKAPAGKKAAPKKKVVAKKAPKGKAKPKKAKTKTRK